MKKTYIAGIALGLVGTAQAQSYQDIVNQKLNRCGFNE